MEHQARSKINFKVGFSNEQITLKFIAVDDPMIVTFTIIVNSVLGKSHY